MGIQDRDYYRNEGPSIFDSLMPQGIVCRWLIGINVAVFILQVSAQVMAAATFEPDPLGLMQPPNGWVNDWFMLDVDKVLHGQVWRLLTFAFLHSTQGYYFIFHILFNMYALWYFGSGMEQLYGRKEFLAIYLFSAVLGGVAWVLWSICWGRPYAPCLGASGAVTTMLILCALHYPRRIIYIYILPMPVWAFALFSVALDSYRIFQELHGVRSGVAVAVHLAGAAFAVGYYELQWSITGTFRNLAWWQARRNRPRLKLFNPDPEAKEPVAVSAHSAPPMLADEHLEAKLDAVLEKIAKWGKESLTQQEQDILKQAAAMYKKRRS